MSRKTPARSSRGTRKNREPDGRRKPDTRARKKVTINDIARFANMSKKTVSRVINDSPLVREETREKIRALIQEYDFTPDPQAQALAFRRSFLIGLIYDNPSPQYVVSIQRGIFDSLDGTAYQLVVRPCDRSAPTFHADMRNFVERQKLFGVILPPSVSEDERLIEVLREIACPYVRIASVSLDNPANMIETHDGEGAAQAARHIAGLGHRRIAHIRGPSTFRSSHERLRGFSAGLAESGLRMDPGMVLEGAYTYESGVECATRLFARSDRPTAIFVGNDEMAVGVYQAADSAGLKVPSDLSVVGFDDAPMASRIRPPLTTVLLPIRDMGRMAAEMLIANRNRTDAGAVKTASFVPVLVVRASTAPPPGGG